MTSSSSRPRSTSRSSSPGNNHLAEQRRNKQRVQQRRITATEQNGSRSPSSRERRRDYPRSRSRSTSRDRLIRVTTSSSTHNKTTTTKQKKSPVHARKPISRHATTATKTLPKRQSSREDEEESILDSESSYDDDSSSKSSSDSDSDNDSSSDEKNCQGVTTLHHSSSHLRTPVSTYATSKRRLNLMSSSVGGSNTTSRMMVITTSPQTPASAPGDMMRGSTKPRRRKIKYNAAQQPSPQRRKSPQQVEGEKIVMDDDGFQAVHKISSGNTVNISTWEMRQRFQREFPGEPVPSDLILRQLYKAEKVTEYERRERYELEFPGEPVPSDEVLKKLYQADIVPAVAAGAATATLAVDRSPAATARKTLSQSLHKGDTSLSQHSSNHHRNNNSSSFSSIDKSSQPVSSKGKKLKKKKNTSSSSHHRLISTFEESLESLEASFASFGEDDKDNNNSNNEVSKTKSSKNLEKTSTKKTKTTKKSSSRSKSSERTKKSDRKSSKKRSSTSSEGLSSSETTGTAAVEEAWQKREKWKASARTKSAPMPPSASTTREELERSFNGDPFANINFKKKEQLVDEDRSRRLMRTKSMDPSSNSDDPFTLNNNSSSFGGDPFAPSTTIATSKRKSKSKSASAITPLHADKDSTEEDLYRSFSGDPFANTLVITPSSSPSTNMSNKKSPSQRMRRGVRPTTNRRSPANEVAAVTSKIPSMFSSSFGTLPRLDRSLGNLMEYDDPTTTINARRNVPARSRSGDLPVTTTKTAIDLLAAPAVLQPPKKDSRSKHHLNNSMNNWGFEMPEELVVASEDDGNEDGVSIHLNQGQQEPLSPITLATRKVVSRPMMRRGGGRARY